MDDPLIPFQQPTLSESLGEFGPPTGIGKSAEKQVSAQVAAEEKRVALGSINQSPRLAATAAAEGRPIDNAEIINDMLNRGESFVVQKYGPEAAQVRQNLIRERIAVRDADTTSRSPDQIFGDTARAVASGAVSGLGGIGAFGAGLVSDQAGAFVAGAVNDATGAIQDSKSLPLRKQKEQAGFRGELDRQDIAAQFQGDIEAGVSFPKTRRFLNEAGRAGQDLFENPALAGDLVAEGIGSLAGSIGINGIIAKAGAKVFLAQQGLKGEAAKKFLASAEGRALTRSIAEKGMPVSIGALEAGGTFTGIQGEIQAMTEEELNEGSEEYRALREDGLSHEVARDRIANIAALEGGAIQGLVGGVTGKLVARFEVDPLGLTNRQGATSFVKALENFGSNILREGTEEGLQGASSNLATGFAIQRHADESRDITEGAGTDAVQGLVAGVGLATTLGAPQLAVRGTVAGAQAVGRGVVNAVTGRLNQVEADNDDASPVGNRAGKEAAVKINDGLTQLEAVLTNPEISQEFAPEAAADLQARAERLRQVGTLTGPEINATPDAVKRVLSDGQNVAEDVSLRRSDILMGVLDQVKQKAIPKADQAAVAIWLFEQAQLFEGIRGQDFSALGEEAQQILADTGTAVDTILANPSLASMIEQAREVTSEDLGSLPDITPENVSTPEVQQAVQRQITLAQANPAGVDPNFINQILNQRAAGGFGNLREEVIQSLRAAAAIVQEIQAAAVQKEAITEVATKAVRTQPGGDKAAIAKTSKQVSLEINQVGFTDVQGNPSKTKLSLSDHLARVVNSIQQGQDAEAQTFLNNLRNFGEHMQNKVGAAVESLALNKPRDNKVKFRTFTGSTFLEADHPGASDIGISPFSENSLLLGRDTVVDAETVSNLFNNLLTIYQGRFSGEPLPAIQVPPILRAGSATPARAPAVRAAPSAPVTPARTQASKTETPKAKAAPAPQAEAQPKAEEKQGRKTVPSRGERVNAPPPEPFLDGEDLVIPADETTPATPEEQQAVNRILETANGTFSTTLFKPLRLRVLKYSADVQGGFFLFNVNHGKEGELPTVVLTQDMAAALNDETNPLSRLATHVVVHEAMHEIDSRIRGSRWKDLIDTFEREHQNAPAAVRKIFEQYALTHTEEKTRNKEIFSELGAFMFSSGLAGLERLRKNYPETTRLMTQLFENGAVPSKTETSPKPKADIVSVSTNRPAPKSEAEIQNLGFAQQAIERMWRLALDLGVVDEIEQLAARSLTAKQTVKRLGDKLKRLDEIAKLNDEPLMAQGDKETLVRAVRSKLDIPSVENTAEFAKWLASFNAKRLADVVGNNAATFPVVLSGDGPFVAKDQKKASQANKFIGRGSASSSTNRYAKDFGKLANTGNYTAEDTVFISAEGSRSGRLDPNFVEIQKAIDAGATLITDGRADRERPFNKGERQVAEYLEQKGYEETRSGVWVPVVVKQEVSRENVEGEAEAAARSESAEPTPVSESREEAGAEAAANQNEAGPAEESAEPAAARSRGLIAGPTAEKDSQNAGDAPAALTFDHLPKRSDGTSRFESAYTIDPTKSELIQNEQPLVAFAQLIVTTEKANESLGLDYELRPDHVEALQKLVKALSATIKKMDARLTTKNKNLKTLKTDGSKPLTPLEAIAYKGKDFLGFRDTQVLNLVNTETGQYDSRLVQAAAVASLHWLLNNSPEGNLDLEEVAKRIGLKGRESEVTPEQRRAANTGFSAKRAVERMADTILEFWGASLNTSFTDSAVRGIVEGLAIELLLGMRENLVTESVVQIEAKAITRFNRTTGETFQDIPTMIFVQPSHESTLESFKRVGTIRTVLADIFLPDAKVITGQALLDEIPSLKGSLRGQETGGAKVQAALKNQNATAFFRNTPFITLMKAIGRQNYMELLGFQTFDPAVTHPMHAASMEGKNKSLERAWDETMNHDARVLGHAETNTKPVDEVATHFTWWRGANGRMMPKGFSGQGDKTMREAYVATQAVLDLSEEANQDRFWVTVAQSAGVVRTEIIGRSEAARAAQEKLLGDLPNTLEILATLDEGVEFTNTQWATIQRELSDAGLEPTPKLVHALLAVTRFQEVMQAFGQDSPMAKNFAHDLSLEADGKADGPTNGIKDYTTGEFTQDELDNLAKGGLTLNEADKTLNAHYAEDKEGDLYTTTAKLTEIFVNQLATKIAGGGTQPFARQQAVEQQRALMRFLTHFGDLEFDKQGNITIGRNVLKNPVTITMYGSKEAGIADKIASAARDVFYARISELLQYRQEMGQPTADFSNLPGLNGYEQLEADIELLFTKKIAYSTNKKGYFVTDELDFKTKEKAPLPNPRKLLKFFFSKNNMSMFRENALTMLVRPMGDAIREKLGTAYDTSNLLVQSSQIQSVLVQERFRLAVEARRKERRDNGEIGPREELSQDDIKAIFAEVRKFGVIIQDAENDEGFLNLTKRTKTLSTTDFSRGLGGEYGGDSSVTAPKDVSVSIVSMLTISRGDGMMMINYYAGKDPSLKTLEVFDGIEMAADEIEKVSEGINKAWSETVLANPIETVSDSYQAWLRTGAEKGVTNRFTHLAIYRAADTLLPPASKFWIQRYEEAFELAKADVIRAQKLDADAIGPFDQENGFEAEITAAMLPLLKKDAARIMKDFANRLEETATSVKARKEVLSGITFSSDHMASGESAYTHHGGPIIEGDLLTELNTRYNVAKDRLDAQREDKKTRPAVQAPTKQFQDKIDALGQRVEGSKLRVLTSRQALELFRGETQDHTRMAQFMARVLPDFRFVFGTEKELTAYRDAKYPLDAGADAIGNGQIDFANGVIYIANAAPETPLHEMLHAALTRQFVAFYTGEKGVLSDNEKQAIENLETMMDEFRTLRLDFENPGTAEAGTVLQGEIEKYLGIGGVAGKSAALNEFVAWGLSNQNLVDLMRKTKVRSKLGTLVQKILVEVRRILRLPETQSLDMFSNLSSNVGSLLVDGRRWRRQNGQALSSVPAGMRLNQVNGRAGDVRLDQIMQAFDLKIASHLRTRASDPKVQARRSQEGVEIKVVANEALNLIMAGGFNLDPQQQSAFMSIQAALASSMQLDSRAMIRIQKLFTHVVGQIPVDSFNVLMERYGSLTDTQGRSTLLASFLALSQVDPEFRKMLADTRLPKDRALRFDSVDAALTSMADGLLTSLSTAISGEGRGNLSALASLDRLTQVLARIEEDDRTLIEKKANEVLGTGDAIGAKFLSKVGERLVDFADAVTAKEIKEGRKTNRTMLAKGFKALAALVDENRGKAMTTAVVGFQNTSRNIPQVVLDIITEVIGVTDENRGVLGLVNRVKYAISGMRQDYRETLPKLIAEQFSRKLSKEEWTQLYRALGKTDIAALGSRSAEDVRKLLTEKKALDAEIKGTEELLRGLTPKDARDYFRKAEELAEFMMTGKPARDLLRNAEAISRLLSEPNAKTSAVDPATVQAIDELVSLYAIRKLDQASRDGVVKLATDESAGVDFVTLYLVELHRLEKAKVGTNEVALLNGWKGHIPSEARDGATLIVKSDTEHNKLVSLGYTRLGEYKGSGAERGKRSYYFSTVAGRNSYQQGAMQTVQRTTFGVDPRTGRTMSGLTAGHVPNQMVGVIKQRLAAQGASRRAGEALLPIYDGQGEVTGYELSMAPEMLEALGRNTHLGEMIGAWAGRQAEEDLAQSFNEKLVDRLHEAWVRDKRKGRGKKFVNISDPDLKDPIQREAWKLVPPEMQSYIRRTFGEDGFMVRKDMVNNAVGYRAASVADLFTGNTRNGVATRKAFTKTATVLFGNDAFPWLVRSEKFWQAGISVAKHTIVIRSVIVPMSNLASNILQLTALGVSARDIIKGFPAKLVEIDQHLKNLQRGVEIKALKARFRTTDQAQFKRLEAEEKLLEDASRRMSIWPLIEAGEFSTIAEGQTEVDAAIADGKWSEWMQDKMERVPAKLGTLGRYALITRDTALYKGMSRATQYGDFLGKAVLYDHLTKRENQTGTKALEVVSEEFVNYNLLPGRTRSYAESMGLTWFWAYKLRSVKIAHRTLRDHPLRALLSMGGSSFLPDLPGVSVGSPITDNILGVAADGRLGYSVGPDMLFNAPGLNPWINIMN